MPIFAAGKTTLTNQFICLTPFIGYRLLDKKMKMDLTTGFEMAACISRKEKIDAHDTMIDGTVYSSNNDLAKCPDYRIRVQLNTAIGRLGLNTGYAIGMENYYGKEQVVQSEARSRFIRLGMSYRLN